MPDPADTPPEPDPIEDALFAPQRTGRAELPDPRPLLENLTRCVIEILGGVREIDQIARWVSDDVYRHLLKRVVLSARARHAKGRNAQRVPFTIGTIIATEPDDGIIESVIMVHNRARTRAVAIRLEGIDNRWRATAINVL
ncbi:3-hydroxyacyl-CoA dehydrogenase [Microbacteriaceae bacterium VKM Ac-2855]|nr:3-hydroxyacyl-CoA dehydrogenase [Microbacteriaceae bacterium VKM Ac-2855]